MDFCDDRPGAVILLGDDQARGTASALRQLLPNWTCQLVDDCAQLDDLDSPDIQVGLAVAPHRVDGPTWIWLDQVARAKSDVLWIAVIGADHRNDPQFMRAMAATCHDFIITPIAESTDIIRGLLEHAARIARLRAQFPDPPLASDSESPDLLGHCPAIQRLRKRVVKFARTDASVMICGETGTGKELVARATHRASRRAAGPFVAVNCGAIPENLLESELFGHVKGAFTGAVQNRSGRVELAHGGTLFLDEIGDLAHSHQVKILRFLQEGSFERVGSPHSTQVDARIIVATHVDLEAAVRERTFRDDLFYRLNVLRIDVPPLRERGDDIELLALHFLASVSDQAQTPAKGFRADALAALRRHHWPGNVRELINRVRKAAILAEGVLITPEELELQSSGGERGFSLIDLHEARMRAERTAIEHALHDSNFNLSLAANLLGISRMTIYRLLKKHGMEIV